MLANGLKARKRQKRHNKNYNYDLKKALIPQQSRRFIRYILKPTLPSMLMLMLRNVNATRPSDKARPQTAHTQIQTQHASP